MKYRTFRLHPGRLTTEAALCKMVALGCVLFGFFWLLVLSPQAWRFAAAFGTLGSVAAAFGLSRPALNRADRIILRATLLAGLATLAASLHSVF